MRLGRLIKTDMKRALLSWRFFVSMLGVTLLMVVALGNVMPNETNSVWYLMESAIQGSGMTSTILCLLPVFAFGISYAAEYEQKAERYWLVRTGTTEYVISKVIVSAIGGFWTVFGGLGIFILVFSMKYPLFTILHSSFLYEMIASEGRILEGYLMYMIHHGLSGAIMAACAVWFSTIVPNRFCAAVAPMLLYFSLLRVTGRMKLPGYVDPAYWNSGIYYADTVGGTIFIKIITTLILCSVFCVLAKRNLDRRLLNE